MSSRAASVALALAFGSLALSAQDAEYAPASPQRTAVAVTASAPQTMHSMLGPSTYLNGGFITQTGVGFGGADVSEVIAPSGLFGDGCQQGVQRLADDFTVPPEEIWELQTLTLYAYQTDSTTVSTFTGATVRVWDGPPGAGGSSILAGDDVTNRLVQSAFSNVYRVAAGSPNSTSRPIMAVEVDLSWVSALVEGTYWIDFALSGDTGLAGPFAPPVSPYTPGNVRRFTVSSATWSIAADGSAGPYELPFELNYKPTSLCGDSREQSSTPAPGTPVPSAGTGGGGFWPFTLPSSPTILSTTLTCPVNCIDRVTLDNLQHTYVGDLQVVLEDPLGVRYNLIVRPGSDGTSSGSIFDYLGGTLDIVDPQLPTARALPNAADIPAGAYRQHIGVGGPIGTLETPLRNITGPAGTWRLFIYDWISSDVGTIDGFSIHYNGCRSDAVVLMPDSTNNRLVSFSAVDGRVINSSVFPLTPSTTPLHAIQVGSEVWISEQVGDRVSRYDIDGNLLGAIGPTFLGGGLDNIRGMARIGNTIYVTNSGTNNGAPGPAVLRFNTSGDFLGATALSATSPSPYGLLELDGDVLVSSSSAGDDVHRYTLGLGSLGLFHDSTSVNFAQQMVRTDAGNVLCTAFSSSALVELDGATGALLASVPASSARGVSLLANGKLLWSNSSGAHVYDPEAASSTQIYTGGGRYLGLYESQPSVPQVYCTAGTSSNGCLPSISANVQPNLSNSAGCIISVTSLEGQKQGLVFYGVNNVGFTPNPWGSGNSFSCVKAPTQRTGTQNSGGIAGLCNGSFGLLWDSYQSANPSSLGNPFGAGDNVYVQAWYRDPAAVKTTNLSNALKLTYMP
jgi:subtilisin-like proprotein convertase family protein